MKLKVSNATKLPIRIDFGLNCFKLNPIFEKVSLEYFKMSQTKTNIGTLYPKFGMSSVCGKMTITDIVIILSSISFILITQLSTTREYNIIFSPNMFYVIKKAINIDSCNT
ncbi:hypothetical protein [Winogradskyella sp. KYW1333]|uniref:hypothetical protein n=2 Tax=unclassified Winogradskyella TaxID=2615021 RepID=UPI0015F0CC5D|nr:hypothetical protein [Winogradskyella sp. KYW1333]